MSDEKAPSIADLLRNTPIMDVLTPKQTIISVQHDEHPIDSFKTLLAAKILSAPVLKNGKFIGFLDMKDLTHYVVFAVDSSRPKKSRHQPLEASAFAFGDNVSKMKFLEMGVLGVSLSSKDPMANITNSYLANRHANSFIAHTESLFAAALVLARGSHRVAVLDAAGTVVNIISQSSVVAFLAHHAPHFAAEFDRALSAIGLGALKPVAVVHDQTAIEVFRLMAAKNISGVPVVDDVGTWVGNVSGSDLKLFIERPCLELLNLPIMSFLASIRSDDLEAEARSPTIGVRSDATLLEAILKLSTTKMHRLIVADSPLYHPAGVLSLTDILRHFFSQNQQGPAILALPRVPSVSSD